MVLKSNLPGLRPATRMVTNSQHHIIPQRVAVFTDKLVQDEKHTSLLVCLPTTLLSLYSIEELLQITVDMLHIQSK